MVRDRAQSHVSRGAAGQGNVSSSIDELHAAVGGLHAAVDALEGRFTTKSVALWGSRASLPPIEGHSEGQHGDVEKKPAAAGRVKRTPVWARVDSETDAAGSNRKDIPRAEFAIARTDQVCPSVVSELENTQESNRCEPGVTGRDSRFHISGHSASVSPSSKGEKISGAGYSDASAGTGSENERANTPHHHGYRGGSNGGGFGEGSGSGGGVGGGGGGGGGGCWREYKTVRSGLSYW